MIGSRIIPIMVLRVLSGSPRVGDLKKEGFV